MNKDKDKDKDAFIVPKEFVSHMMMTQTKDKLFHHWNQIYKVYTLHSNSKHYEIYKSYKNRTEFYELSHSKS